MAPWKTIRICLLATLFVGVLGVLFKLLLFPNSSQLAATSFVFPTTVPLPQWQLVESLPLKITDDPNFIASRRYRYQQNKASINVDMHYIINSSGDLKDSLRKHIIAKGKASSLVLREKPEMGFYAFFTNQGNAYLTSCINPRGGSTVTFDQFRQNRNTYDLQPGRLFLWLLGLKELRDWRCLWTLMSIPVETENPDEAFSLLESAWFSWYPWWAQRFPPS